MKFTLVNKISVSVALLGLVILLAGCPYSSSVPIDQGSIKIPKSLVGKWVKSSDDQTENPTYFEISIDESNASKATALKYEYSSSDSTYQSTRYQLTFSDVNGDMFMNAMEDGGSTYSLFKFNFDESSGDVTTYEVSDYIKETFSSSTELKGFIAKNKENSYFFTNTVDTYKKK
ncbi:MAG: hypothetical protein HXX13_06050 [Bacteroidetes bacterium]|nr:hypothetical protein [Bacteroidota bacterium]